jgi:hypothetical protein
MRRISRVKGPTRCGAYPRYLLAGVGLALLHLELTGLHDGIHIDPVLPQRLDESLSAVIGREVDDLFPLVQSLTDKGQTEGVRFRFALIEKAMIIPWSQ